MQNLMISVSGVRGIVGQGLTPEVALSFAQAFGLYCQRGKIVVGRDSRVTGEMLKHAVIAGLLAVGCDVVDIDISPTPTTQLCVENIQAAGGIMITASHNPIEWNGLKLISSDGLFLDAEQGQQVLKIRESNQNLANWNKIGQLSEYQNAIEDHITAILTLDYIQPQLIKKYHFKVVVDCVCGAGTVVVPSLLQKLGCETVLLNCKPTGLFPRNPEPLPENLTQLSQAVLSEKADLGFAVDPDGDRLAIVSESGQPIGEEKTLALAVKFMSSKKPGPVVMNASTSLVTESIAREYGVPVVRTPVGEIHVAKKMREIGAVIGGEGNGGVILADVHLGRDALVGMTLILQLLAESGQSIDSINASLPKYEITKGKVELKNISRSEVVERLQQIYANEDLDFTDGIKINRKNSWIHVRPSNTEPIIRVIAEAPTLEESQSLVNEMIKQIEALD
ncbi:MAG: phosphoglucosamine mutase [Calditrichaeota bacterium]|nr:MAG: phosphoglucosamine mutase [Calditrichota bacterium]